VFIIWQGMCDLVVHITGGVCEIFKSLVAGLAQWTRWFMPAPVTSLVQGSIPAIHFKNWSVTCNTFKLQWVWLHFRVYTWSHSKCWFHSWSAGFILEVSILHFTYAHFKWGIDTWNVKPALPSHTLLTPKSAVTHNTVLM
jgi:hypothetical protein